MPSFKLDGNTFETDDQGFLVEILNVPHPNWDLKVANYLARSIRIDMTCEHILVIVFVRKHYETHKSVPEFKVIVSEIGEKFDKNVDIPKILHKMFPGGPTYQATLIAGLPQQTR